MLEVRGDLDLTQEPLDPDHRSEVGTQDLQGDWSVVLHIASEVHGRHAALTHLAVNDVPAGKRCIELFGGMHTHQYSHHRAAMASKGFALIWNQPTASAVLSRLPNQYYLLGDLTDASSS